MKKCCRNRRVSTHTTYPYPYPYPYPNSIPIYTDLFAPKKKSSLHAYLSSQPNQLSHTTYTDRMGYIVVGLKMLFDSKASKEGWVTGEE
ncbi:hypothetical protein EON65_10575, partial [archaeon]